MSNTLEQFKKSYATFTQYKTNLMLDLLKSHPHLISQLNAPDRDFSKSPWTTLDSKTLIKFKSFAIYGKVESQLLPVMYPGLVLDPEKMTFLSGAPAKLTPIQISQALDSIQGVAAETLQEIRNNRAGSDVVLDFLKACVNFLITIVTLGRQPGFFHSSTFQVEQIIKVQERMNTLVEQLDSAEKEVGLDMPVVEIKDNPVIFVGAPGF